MSAGVEEQVDGFLSAYLPEIAADARAARRRMRERLPDAIEMVYDNYNALVFGYSFSERPSEAILSLAIMPQWVTLCFLFGATLDDSRRLLKGSGSQVRSVRLESVSDLDSEGISNLIDQAITNSPAPRNLETRGSTIVRSISKKQRPRRPSTAKKKSSVRKKR